MQKYERTLHEIDYLWSDRKSSDKDWSSKQLQLFEKSMTGNR